MDSNYKIETMTFNKLQGCIKLPTFQRSTVWSEEKRKSFIDTILSGLPFGSLLLYKKSPSEYLLVDGLQRFTTIEDFIKNPYNYLNVEVECKDSVNKILNLLKSKELSTDYGKLRYNIYSSIKKNFTFSTKKSDDIVDAIIKDIDLLNDLECYKILHHLINQLQNKFDIKTLEIPLICFNGDYDDLPAIFERMNSNGTKLSKYEIYAAKWSGIEFSYHDSSLLQLVDDKYHNMIENTGVEILNYTDGQFIREQKINLFEFCFALGKLLQNDCPNLFGKPIGKTSDVDSIGFVLLSVILTKSPKSINNLSKYFNNITDDNAILLNKLKDKILECTKSVNTILSQYIITLDNKKVTKYIESQMVCIIATLFNIRYSINNKLEIKENRNSKLFLAFKKNMPKRYLYDIISSYWSGNGDARIADEMSKSLEDNRYLSTITRQSWESVLMEWMLPQTQKQMKRIPDITKLFLNYIIRLNVPSTKYQGKKLEFDYIISKEKFNKTFKDLNGIAAVGNICLIPQYENRSKQGCTLYEVTDNRSSVYNIKKEVLEDFLYPERDELNFVLTKSTFTCNNYMRFLKDRHNYLINKFISLIGE